MHHRVTRAGRASLLALAGVLVLVACGDDTDEDTRGDSRREEDGTESDDDGSTRGDDDRGDPNATEAATPPGPMPTLDEHLTCPETSVAVAGPDELADALAAAQPGDVIRLAAGTYKGRFVATAMASESEPIYVCGPRDAVIDGGGIKGGYAVHLDGASGWRLIGFTVRNAQKGVVADRVVGAVFEGLLVDDIGDEAIHLRTFSTDNVVRNNSFDGSALSGADSWVDAKGNGWVIESNIGVNSPMDGFQMHEILDGWATDNLFRNNVALVHGPGHGLAVTNTEGNIVSCDNEVVDAADGFADVECPA